MPQTARRHASSASSGKRKAGRASNSAAAHQGARRRRTPGDGRHVRRWSASVTRNSDALDLDSGVFRLPSPTSIAESLKRSADRSKRRKAEPFRSAMSMLVFYINRAGRSLPAGQRRVLESAKDELRRLYHRESQAAIAKG